MRHLFTLSLLALGACSPAPDSADTSPAAVVGDVVVTALAPGVYAAIRQEPLGLAINANSLFIVNDDGVVVVDAQFTRRATLENLAALRQVTDKPVRYVVHTHWHDDHLAGTQVYRDSFPGVRFLAHASTRRDLVTRGRANRDQQVRFAPPAADRYERLLDMGLGGDSTPVSPAESLALSSSVRIIREYVAENSGYEEILPDTLESPRTVIPVKGRVIEVHWFGRGNTAGDVVVWLPKERVVATGDLVVWPIPLAFFSYPSEWPAVLDSVRGLDPAVIVPGHGPVMRDTKYVETVQRMLRTAGDEVRAGVAAGLNADSLVARIQLTELRDEIAGDEKWMRTMFGMFFRRPVIGRLHQEITAGTLK